MPRQATCLCGDCQKCKHRDYMREWYRRKTPEERRAWVVRRDPEKVRAADRARYHRDKPKRRALVKLYHARYPEKQKARQAVSNAIRDHRLERGPCAECGATEDDRGRPIQGHHGNGYENALDVTWLCQKHHTTRHPRPF